MKFKKTAISMAVILGVATATNVKANELDINSFAARQSSKLPASGSYKGFIVYLKENNSTRMSVQSAKQALDTIDNLEIDRKLATGGYVVSSLTELGIFSSSTNGVRYQEDENLRIYNALRSHPDVALVEPNLILSVRMQPNDEYYDKLWALNDVDYGINVESTWDNYKGSGVNVAVIDTGIVSHSDLNSNVRGGYDFISSADVSQDGDGRDSDPTDEGDWFYESDCDPNGDDDFYSSSWHGTHVAGTIAMVGNNRKGGIGVAPEATIVPVRVLGRCGGTSADISDAIVWASGGSVRGVPSNDYPADVINMSLGGRSDSCPYTYQRAINTAVSNGSTVVVAAGNSNANVSGFTPANCDKIIAVGALGAEGDRAAYSNYGTGIDISAPGGDQRSAGEPAAGILSTVDRGSKEPIGEGYTYMDGTSMAAPHVAGVVALLLDKEPDLTPAQVESRLKDGARPIPGSCYVGCGEGIVDVGRTLGSDDPDTPNPTPGDNVLTKGVAVDIEQLDKNDSIEFTLEVPEGAKNLSIEMSGGTGDADLFVQHESSSSVDCQKVNYGNNSTCSFASPKAGTYYIKVSAYSTAYNFSLVADYEVSSDDGDSKEIVITGTIEDGEEGYSDEFYSNAGRIEAEMVAESRYADIDLYLQKKSSTGNWLSAASSLKPAGSIETISYQAAAATYRWRVKSYSGTSKITLTYKLP